MAVALGVLLIAACVAALNNGLLLTPNMGYNTWYDVMCTNYMNESTVRATAQAMISTGLAKVGYKYINLDDCWASTRTKEGVITSDPNTFPSGMQSLASYVHQYKALSICYDHYGQLSAVIRFRFRLTHSQGLLFGVYTDRGVNTCAGRPGSFGHEKIDAQTYASWGVDFLKEDSCNTPDSTNHSLAFAEYALMRDSLNATGRPIAFDLCGWYSWYSPVGRTMGNLWRIGPDDSNWPGILTNININSQLSMFAGPGGWNNPCLLLSQDYTGAFVVTEQQTMAQFSMWAVMASPLTISGNIRNMTLQNLQTYLNSEVIAVNQDPMGRQGIRIVGGDLAVNGTGINGSNVWGRPLADGSWAVVLINTSDMAQVVSCDADCFAVMGFDGELPVQGRDLWKHQDLAPFSPPTLSLTLAPSGGVAMLKVSQLPL